MGRSLGVERHESAGFSELHGDVRLGLCDAITPEA